MRTNVLGGTVIKLQRLHGAGEIVVNADLIETMEACPDTTIQLVTRRRFVVADPIDEVIGKVAEWRSSQAPFVKPVLQAGHDAGERAA